MESMNLDGSGMCNCGNVSNHHLMPNPRKAEIYSMIHPSN